MEGLMGEREPVSLTGEEKPIRSNEIEEYLDEGFWYYLDVYYTYKHAGPPFSTGWSEWPAWFLTLIRAFDRVYAEIDNSLAGKKPPQRLVRSWAD
jgi:hypothetical protein